MKWIFYFLLLANVVLFAWPQLAPREVHEPAVLQRQINADKVRLLPPGQPAPAPQAAAQACVEWGSFAGAELARAEQALAALALGDRLSQRRQEEVVRWWVYMPPLRSRAEAERKQAELVALGVQEHYVIQEAGEWNNAISLGVFRSEEAARAHLAKLQAQGVRSAVVGERSQSMQRVKFQVRDPDEALTQRLVGIQQQFPGSELKAVPCS